MTPHRDNYTFLTTAPVSRVVWTMAVPTILSMMVTNLYNLADTFFVSQIDTQSTAAVGIAFSIMAVVQAIGYFFGHGSGNYISRKLGARHLKAALIMSSTGFTYSICFGVVLAVVLHVLLTPLAVAIGSTPTILPYTESYLGIILYGTPFMTATLTMNNQMRFQGNAAYAMCGILAGALINMALDPLFIFGLDMGVRGAAWATVVSQACCFLIMLRMSGHNGGIRMTLRNFSLSPQLLKEIMFGGTPSLSRQALAAVSTIALNTAAGAYSDAAIAGMSIVTRICFLVFAVVIGLGQGYQPLCGFCYGAGLYARVREGFSYCVRVGTVFMIGCALAGMLFTEDIVRLFRDDPAVIATGTAALRWRMIAFALLPFIGLSNMLLQTIRKPVQANITAAARNGIFFLPLIFILPRFFGLAGVEMCQAASDVCTFFLCLPLVARVFRGMPKG